MTTSSASTADLGRLPEWDLSDLYDGVESDDLARDLEQGARAAADFKERYGGRLEDLDGAGLATAIREFEEIQESLGRIGSYAQLVYAGNVSDPNIGKFYQSTNETLNEISSDLLFFALEINRLDDAVLETKLQTESLARYRPWLRDVRAFRPYELADDLERLLHDKRVAGYVAWVRLYDETMAELRFPFDGKELSSTEILDFLTDPDQAVRRTAGKSFGEGLGRNVRLFAHITNTLAKDKAIEDRWRGFDRPVSSRNLNNFVEDEVVDALVESVRSAYPRLSHRYYALKAKWMGQDHLDYWDRNAPLPESDERLVEWDEARHIVLDAYGAFSDELAAVGGRFFENAWIDAPVRPGKAPGAFAHPTVPSAHPYLLLNYQGKTRDVMTLAHELGHGVHQVLAGDQGQLMSNTPLTLAETASVFGEMLTFRAMLAGESEPRRRREMLAGKVEDMLNTVVRQIAFHAFETKVHGERQDGALLPDRLSEIWMEVQAESLGPTFRFDDEYKYYWCYIPHFIHVPFYVYAYAFGDCLVNSLYATYEKAHAGFAEKYLEMLRAGGTKRHRELLEPFGLDASDPAFWARGLEMIAGFIDELEAMDQTG